jgi:predicted Abi (CAAX) family protease
MKYFNFVSSMAWKLGALSLISAIIIAASLVSAPPAAAEPAAQGITEEQGVRATLNVRLQSIRLAFETFPNYEAWHWCVGLFGVYTLCALMIGLLTGFCRLELMKASAWSIASTPIVLLVMPCLVEELFFRAILLPHPVEAISPRTKFLWASASLTAFVVSHPINGLVSRRLVFLDPVFLVLATLLGIVCTITYLKSGSIWLPILFHWLTVVVWIMFLGGWQKVIP